MPTIDPAKSHLVEAARYALLRRLVPSISHNLTGALQPVNMMAAILEKRIKAPSPDLALLAKSSASLTTLSDEAIGSCLDLMTWLTPKHSQQISIHAGINDAIGVMKTELSFRDISMANEAIGVSEEMPQHIFRSVFLASLIALTDAAPSPGRVVITARVTGDEIVLTINLTAVEGANTQGQFQAYREIGWDDVQLLAEAEGVSCEHKPNQVAIRYRVV